MYLHNLLFTLNFPILQSPSHLKKLNSWSGRGHVHTRDVNYTMSLAEMLWISNVCDKYIYFSRKKQQ